MRDVTEYLQGSVAEWPKSHGKLAALTEFGSPLGIFSLCTRYYSFQYLLTEEALHISSRESILFLCHFGTTFYGLHLESHNCNSSLANKKQHGMTMSSMKETPLPANRRPEAARYEETRFVMPGKGRNRMAAVINTKFGTKSFASAVFYDQSDDARPGSRGMASLEGLWYKTCCYIAFLLDTR